MPPEPPPSWDLPEDLSDEDERDAIERWMATLPEGLLGDLAAAEFDALLIRADLSGDQEAALDAPWGLAVVPSLAEALDAQKAVLDELDEIARGALGADDEAAEQALADLRAATAHTAARISAADAQALRAVQARTAALSRRRASLAAWHRSLLAQMPQGPGARLLYLLALAGDQQARQELSDVTRARAAHPALASQDLLAVQILALLEALEALGADAADLLHQIAILLAAVVLAPALYRRRRDPKPRDLLRGSLELNAPPSLRACSTLREMATAVGDPRTSP